MWAWALRLLPGVGRFLKAYWKVFAVAGAAAAIFFAGAKWEDAKHAEERARIAEQTAAAIAAREEEIRRIFEIQQEEEALARMELADDLEALARREQILLEEIRLSQLVKPADELVCEGIEEKDGETVILANPFTDDFVRVWNDASRPPASDETDTED